MITGHGSGGSLLRNLNRGVVRSGTVWQGPARKCFFRKGKERSGGVRFGTAGSGKVRFFRFTKAAGWFRFDEVEGYNSPSEKRCV